MTNSGFKAFTDYFKGFVTADNDLKFFMFGDVQKGMDYAMGHENFALPFLWLEEPFVIGDDNGSQYWDEWKSGISFICASRRDSTIDEQITALDLSYTIMSRLEKKLREDYENDEETVFLEMNSKKEKGIIDPIFLADAVGWRMEINYKLTSNSLLHDN